MGGGLLQLVAYGAQDIYLTGNPQITFFKVVYRRHTNFAMESIENVFNGTASFGKRVTCQISRNGDLIHRVYVAINLPVMPSSVGASVSWVPYVGLALLQDVEIEIGGQRIDKHWADWMYIWNELSLPVGKVDGYSAMVGSDFNGVLSKTTFPSNGSLSTNMLHVPLEFWFCRNVGLALPLIALQYHEVKINIDFEQLARLVTASSASGLSIPDIQYASLWVDYIYLDTDERRRFAQLSHEYLIEQLQFTGDETIVNGTNRIKLNYNHPVKELVWVCKRSGAMIAGQECNIWNNYSMAPGGVDSNGVANYLGGGGTFIAGSNTDYNSPTSAIANPNLNPTVSAILQLNGQDRFAERPGNYFQLVQPYQHHEKVPLVPGICVYSFALKPEEHQPSGTLNMSRIDSAVLKLTTQSNFSATGGVAKIFAVNYNVLRIMSGMGGLAYSN